MDSHQNISILLLSVSAYYSCYFLHQFKICPVPHIHVHAASWKVEKDHYHLHLKYIMSERESSFEIVALRIVCFVKVVDIKRLNNMMSEHGIHSRERILIPISSRRPELLSNSTCYIELDAYAKREVVVLYLDGEGRPPGVFPWGHYYDFLLHYTCQWTTRQK